MAKKRKENTVKVRLSLSSFVVQRCWDVALGPLKQIPMNLFIMYMSGNTISIFPIMMVCMMAWRPIQALMSMSASEYPAFTLLTSCAIRYGWGRTLVHFVSLVSQPSSCWRAPVSSGFRASSTWSGTSWARRWPSTSVSRWDCSQHTRPIGWRS